VPYPDSRCRLLLESFAHEAAQNAKLDAAILRICQSQTMGEA
jgi:hypothetical protein